MEKSTLSNRQELTANNISRFGFPVTKRTPVYRFYRPVDQGLMDEARRYVSSRTAQWKEQYGDFSASVSWDENIRSPVISVNAAAYPKQPETGYNGIPVRYSYGLRSFF
eukprot:GILK01016063.1.p1 GENE.GILK01016063.1~~GILK01016063.1.p1  ORF type:complete len:109 (+),score=12.09 GILK01016063.1:487-813(+)